MKDYYEEHGEPEQEDGGDDIEDEEDETSPAGKSTVEHKIQTRVRQSRDSLIVARGDSPF